MDGLASYVLTNPWTSLGFVVLMGFAWRMCG
jgi:hypothetical protein